MSLPSEDSRKGGARKTRPASSPHRHPAPFWLPLVLLFIFILLRGPTPAVGAEVRVLFWFDTEDYLLPASDDAALRLAQLLEERGIRATFKVVGEKARVLQKRGRKDVIEALRRHDIGYHSNLHSVHPTPTEYLADLGWTDGVAEFVRREGPGADDVRRIFGVPILSCYGQPGSSWAPQAVGALATIGCAPHGVPCYVDEGSHVGMDGRLFWYAGALTLYHMGANVTRMDLHGDPSGEEKGIAAFREVHERLVKSGGVVSIFYHPCEWVHREFWDGVNFRRGAQPPREAWRAPEARPAAETDAAFARFGRYVDFIRAQPEVAFVTASDLPRLYPDRLRRDGLSSAAAVRIAARASSRTGVGPERDSGGGENDRDGGGGASGEGGAILSAADQLAAYVELLGAALETGALPERTIVPALLGPTDPPPETEVEEMDGLLLRDTLRAVRAEMRATGHVPSRIFAGSQKIAPADFLVTLASLFLEARSLARAGKPVLPERVEVARGTRLRAAEKVAEDTTGLFGGWIIHREGFRAPRVVEQGKLQAWTLKPAW